MLSSSSSSSEQGDITNTPFDTDTVVPLLNANTVILRNHTPPLSLPPLDGGVRPRKISMQTNEIY